ncbi:uncharacterized protein LOC144536415 isoform X2 [Sander vitreus]
MSGVQHLLLLAVFALLARCQQKPQVYMSPILKQIFSGDLFFLRCNSSTSGNGVTWYFNNIKTIRSEIWKIGPASPEHSGAYQCESGQRSDSFSIKVLGYLPSASLTIVAGQSVVQMTRSVVLQLEHEDGLIGWKCFVNRGGQTKTIRLMLRNDNVSVVFQPRRLNVPETIFWCTDTNEQHRSNQITVRTSVKDVSLEMYPLPAVLGESLILKCLAWGTDQISHTVFYRNNSILANGVSSTYELSNVTESTSGSYKCIATFTHKARTEGPPYTVVSDDQDVFVQDQSPISILTGVVIVLVILGLAAVILYGTIRYKKRNAAGRIYEDMPLRSRDEYEMLQKGAKREGEYDTLHPEAPGRQKKEGEYEALKKEEMTSGEYHTVRMEGAVGGEGGYEALKKEGVYHTLGMEGAAGGGGNTKD